MNYCFLISIVFLIVSNQIDCFKSENYCQKVNNNYKCSTTKITTYECSKMFCAINKKSCEYLTTLNKKTLKKFTETIKHCDKPKQRSSSIRLKFG